MPTDVRWLEGLEATPAPPELRLWVGTLSSDLLEVISTIEQHGAGAWIVGGAVRDVLSGVAPADVDIATTMRPAELATIFPRTLPTGEKFGVVTVRHKGATVECTVLRSSLGSSTDGSRKEEVNFGTTLLEDLSVRDFTVNAMAFDSTRFLLFDPFGGRHDACARLLRAVSEPPIQMLRADALRVLRAYRFLSVGRGALDESKTCDAVAVGKAAWRLEARLAADLQEAAPLLANIAPQRIRKELKQLLSGPHAPEVARFMAENDTFQAVLRTSAPAVTPGSQELRALEALWRSPAVEEALRNAESPTEDRPDPLVHPSPPAKPQPFDFYAAIDFEATCWERGIDLDMEIIELPVVLLDARSGRLAGEFHTFVRPAAHPTLSEYCSELTGIQQSDVDGAPGFVDAMNEMLQWLEGRTAGASVAFVTDGRWDIGQMLPRQWRRLYGGDAELPAVLRSYVDVRDMFMKIYPHRKARKSGKLHKMCRSLAIQPLGRAHSGLADARNVARLSLALMTDGAVFDVKGPAPSRHSDKEEVPAAEPAIPTEAAVHSLFMEAMTLLLGRASTDDVARLCQDLRLSKEEHRFLTDHTRCLGHIPDGNDAGEVRRFLTSFGEAWALVHFRLEEAWAQSFEGDAERRQSTLERLAAARSTMATLRPGSVAPQPLVNGRWLMEKVGVKGGGRLGRLKEWMYYLQVDRDIQDVDAMEAALREINWEHTATNSMPMVSWPPGRVRHLRKTPLARART